MRKHNYSDAILSFLMFFLFCAIIVNLQTSTTLEREEGTLRVIRYGEKTLTDDEKNMTCKFSISADRGEDFEMNELTIRIKIVGDVCLANPLFYGYVDESCTIPIIGAGLYNSLSQDAISVTSGESIIIASFHKKGLEKEPLIIKDGNTLYFKFLLGGIGAEEGNTVEILSIKLR